MSTYLASFVRGGDRQRLANRYQSQERNERQKAKKTSSGATPTAPKPKPSDFETKQEPTLRPQVKLFSLAMTALDTFAQAKVAAINWRNETRLRVTALINGIKVNLLYDTGAMSSCLTPETYERHFSHKKLKNQQNVSASAAGNVDLDVLSIAEFEISVGAPP